MKTVSQAVKPRKQRRKALIGEYIPAKIPRNIYDVLADRSAAAGKFIQREIEDVLKAGCEKLGIDLQRTGTEG